MRKRLDIVDEARRDARARAKAEERKAVRKAFAASQLKWRDKNRVFLGLAKRKPRPVTLPKIGSAR